MYKDEVMNVKEYLSKTGMKKTCYSHYKSTMENALSPIKFKRVMLYLGYDVIKQNGVYVYTLNNNSEEKAKRHNYHKLVIRKQLA